MGRWAKISSGVLATAVVGVGWLAWAESGTAPYPVAYAADKIVSALTGSDPARRCFRTTSENGFTISSYVGTWNCHTLDAPKEFVGIYFDEFEGQKFLDGEQPAERYVQSGPDIWLTFDDQSEMGELTLSREVTQVWLVRFIGRKTSALGQYGHFGMSCSEIVVDRVLSAQVLQRGSGYLSQTLIDQQDHPYKCGSEAF